MFTVTRVNYKRTNLLKTEWNCESFKCLYKEMFQMWRQNNYELGKEFVVRKHNKRYAYINLVYGYIKILETGKKYEFSYKCDKICYMLNITIGYNSIFFDDEIDDGTITYSTYNIPFVDIQEMGEYYKRNKPYKSRTFAETVSRKVNSIKMVMYY